MERELTDPIRQELINSMLEVQEHIEEEGFTTEDLSRSLKELQEWVQKAVISLRV